MKVIGHHFLLKRFYNVNQMSCVMRGSKKTYCLAQEVIIIIEIVTTDATQIILLPKSSKKSESLVFCNPTHFYHNSHITQTLRMWKVRLKKAPWCRSPNYQGRPNPKPKNAKEPWSHVVKM